MAKKNGKDKANGDRTIALNKRARHEYHIEQRLEAGLALQGWELKAIRAGRANIGDAYAVVLRNELFLVGAELDKALLELRLRVGIDERQSSPVDLLR